MTSERERGIVVAAVALNTIPRPGSDAAPMACVAPVYGARSMASPPINGALGWRCRIGQADPRPVARYESAASRLYEGGRVVNGGWSGVVRGRGRVVGVERCSCLYRPVGLRGLGEIGAARPAVHVQSEPSGG
jgi:hypothetical protein